MKELPQRFKKEMFEQLTEAEIINSKNSSKKTKQLEKWINKLERIEKENRQNERTLMKIKELYYQKYLIKEENVPDSYWRHLESVYEERGQGFFNLRSPEAEIDKTIRKEHFTQIREAQKTSLDSWINYFLSSDSDYLPEWAKVWAFQGMLKIGNLKEEKDGYLLRKEGTVSPFVNIDSELVGKSVEILRNHFEKNKNEEELEKISNSESFRIIYGYLLVNKKEIILNGDEGKWVKYSKGNKADAVRLYESLQGYNTGWCTASSLDTAINQLCGQKIYIGGDFYVYYSKDQENNDTIPRIAIRMDNHKIGEIRGIKDYQNLEENMEKILEEKLKEFPDALKYQKRVNDMKKMTALYHKKEEYSKEDLRFLYEIDSQIEGFGYIHDPRLAVLKQKRNQRKDFANIFDCKEENFGFEEEDLPRCLVVHFANLTLKKRSVPANLNRLIYIRYTANFCNLISAEGLNQLQTIGGDAHFDELKSAKGLESLQTIGRDAHFDNLTSAKGLESLQTIGGSAYFKNLTSAEGLGNLQTIGVEARFDSLTSAKGLGNLETIGGSAYFKNLTSAKGLENLQTIGRNAHFDNLTSAEGLNQLRTIGHNADFANLISAKGLENLQTIGDIADFDKLTSAEGLNQLRTIGHNAYFANLTSAKGLENLETIEGNANFANLTSAKGLESLQTIGHNAYFLSLTSAKGLENLQTIVRNARFDNLASAEGLSQLQYIGKDANFSSLTILNGLENLKIEKNLYIPLISFQEFLNSNIEVGESVELLEGKFTKEQIDEARHSIKERKR